MYPCLRSSQCHQSSATPSLFVKFGLSCILAVKLPVKFRSLGQASIDEMKRHEPTWNIEKVVKSVDRSVRTYNRKDYKSVALLIITVVLFMFYMFMDDTVVDTGASETEGDATSLRR